MDKRIFGINYVMKDLLMQELFNTNGKPIYVVEGSGALLPALEKQIRTMKPGEKKNVTVRIRDAYGHHSYDKVLKFKKEEFANVPMEIGQYLILEAIGNAVVRVADITDTQVYIDTNHPLAGRDLYFDVEMIENRPATIDEIKSGKAKV